MSFFNKDRCFTNVHASVDVETLSTDNGGAVFEIGAAVATFHPNKAEILDFDSRCWTFSLHQAMECGDVKPETLAWWIADPAIPQAVRDRLHAIWSGKPGTRQVHIPLALRELNTFLDGSQAWAIWANGAGFDFPMIHGLFRRARTVYGQNARLRPIWGFRDEMCLRPLRMAHGPLWNEARAEVEDAARAGEVQGGLHAADYDCLINLTFLSKVNSINPLVYEEITRDVSDKSRF